jgi:hypothetical protein
MEAEIEGIKMWRAHNVLFLDLSDNFINECTF